MTEKPYRYDQMVENALRSVIKEALSQAVNIGLIGNHHFYITFRTDFSGVEIADWLREKYPEEMTIVLQNQYWDLTIREASFSVSLSFNDMAESLTIPFAAVTAFADPGVNFGLQFQPKQTAASEKPLKVISGKESQPSEDPPEDPLLAPTRSDASLEKNKNQDKIVTLDAFRKKGSP
ncbi:MAG: ClpXP protease specificity-enhancing factor SspB [Alphaproteobacteria bacterium]